MEGQELQSFFFGGGGKKVVRCSTMYFGPISCIGSKFTRMSAHPGASFAWLMECTCGV